MPVQAKLTGIGFSPATVAIGRYLFIMGGVSSLTSETILLDEFINNHTSKSLNVFDYFINKICPVTQVFNETLYSVNNNVTTSNRKQTLEDDNINLTVRLDYPVVGVGSVVQMGSVAYTFGFCNAIPQEVDVLHSFTHLERHKELEHEEEHKKEEYEYEEEESYYFTNNNDNNRFRTGVEYLRSVQELRLFTKVQPEADEVEVNVNSWQLPEEAMLRFNASCVGSKNGLVFIVGGVNALTGKELDSIAIYNVSSKEFVDAVISLPRSLVTPAILAQSELIYIAGGFSKQENSTFHNNNNNTNKTYTTVDGKDENYEYNINNHLSAIDVSAQIFNPDLAFFDAADLK